MTAKTAATDAVTTTITTFDTTGILVCYCQRKNPDCFAKNRRGKARPAHNVGEAGIDDKSTKD